MKTYARASAILSSALLITLTASSCNKRNSMSPNPSPASVRSEMATQADVPITLTTFGNTGNRSSVNIIPQVSGILRKCLISDGAVVTNGQPLFEIDPSDYQTRLHQAEGALAASKASLCLDRMTMERNKVLRDKKLISEELYDTLAAKVEAGEARIRIDEAALELARLNVSRCTLSSPLDGICSKRLIDEGNLVAAGLSVLLNIRSYDPLEVEFSIPEQHLKALRAAMSSGSIDISIIPRGDTQSYNGKLTFIDNAVNTKNGTILLRGSVPNPSRTLWAQQFADVHITLGLLRNAVMVPEGAVQFGKQGAFLFVVTPEGKADRRLVKTGLRHENKIQIVEGLSAGEKVITLGQLTLFPGAAVNDSSTQQAQASRSIQ